MTSFDMIIIGGGPAGYVAAIRGGQLGKKVALVESTHLGGVCLNWGCIPTKALLRSAEMAHMLKEVKNFGFDLASPPQFDLATAVQRSRSISSKLASGIAHLLKKNKVTHIQGHGRLDGPGKVVVTSSAGASETITAPAIILATGARARTLPDLPVDDKRVWTAKEAMVPSTLPKSLVIVGSGAIGIEFASFYNALGVDVTVVEREPRILPVEDPEISAMARKAFEQQGIKIHTETTITPHLEKDHVRYTLTHKGKSTQGKADVLLMAIGIQGNVEGLGLETTQVQVERSHIITQAFGATHSPGIYAIGDVTGPPWLAHKGSHEGIACVEHIAGLKSHALDVTKIPGCTYASPQIASVGYTEPKAQEAGYAVKVGRFNFQANGKALALGDTLGMVKVIFDAATGELLGAHMIGPEVTEMIQGFVIARTLEATEADLMTVIFPHPTLSEAMHEAILDAYDRVIHS